MNPFSPKAQLLGFAWWLALVVLLLWSCPGCSLFHRDTRATDWLSGLPGYTTPPPRPASGRDIEGLIP